MTASGRRAGCLLLCLSLELLGCWAGSSTPGDPSSDDTADGPAWFEDVTDAVGLDFVHDPGPTGTYFMPQSMGCGCAVIHDGDGSLYVYLLQSAGPDSKSINRLYKLEDGKFRDVTEGSGLGFAGHNTGERSATSTTTACPTSW
jgi:hypothetical protein